MLINVPTNKKIYPQHIKMGYKSIRYPLLLKCVILFSSLILIKYRFGNINQYNKIYHIAGICFNIQTLHLYYIIRNTLK